MKTETLFHQLKNCCSNIICIHISFKPAVVQKHGMSSKGHPAILEKPNVILKTVQHLSLLESKKDKWHGYKKTWLFHIEVKQLCLWQLKYGDSWWTLNAHSEGCFHRVWETGQENKQKNMTLMLSYDQFRGKN